jgi:hypothetical protein
MWGGWGDARMKEAGVSKESLGLELEPGIVNVLRVRVVYEDQDPEGDKISKAEVVLCHFWQLEGECACFFRVMEGRLCKARIFTMPVQIMEVEG